MRKNKCLLIIGAGRWQTPLFRKAKEMGLEVAATDPFHDAPGLQFADHVLHVDVRDVEQTLKFAQAHDVAAVITGVDLAVPTVASVASSLGLRGISQECARRVTDKHSMRLKMQELGLAGPRFHLAKNAEEACQAAQQFGFPCIVKPTDNCGSRGVTVVLRERDTSVGKSNETSVAQAFQAAAKNSFAGGVLVEELMTGQETSVEGFIDDSGELRILGISEKKKSDLPYRFDLELHYPGSFSSAQINTIEDYARRLVRGFELTQGLVHIELIIRETEVRLIEIAARGCGGYVIGKLIPAITGVDVLGLYIRQAFDLTAEKLDDLAGGLLDENLNADETKAFPEIQSRHGVLKFIMLEPGRVDRISGLESAEALPGIIDIAVDVKPGDVIQTAKDTSMRHGYVLAMGESRGQADARVAQAMSQVRIEINANR